MYADVSLANKMLKDILSKKVVGTISTLRRLPRAMQRDASSAK